MLYFKSHKALFESEEKNVFEHMAKMKPRDIFSFSTVSKIFVLFVLQYFNFLRYIQLIEGHGLPTYSWTHIRLSADRGARLSNQIRDNV